MREIDEVSREGKEGGKEEGEMEGEKDEWMKGGNDNCIGYENKMQWLVRDLWEVRVLILPSLSGNFFCLWVIC